MLTQEQYQLFLLIHDQMKDFPAMPTLDDFNRVISGKRPINTAGNLHGRGGSFDRGVDINSIIDSPEISLERKFMQLGFIILRNVFSREEIAELKTEAIRRLPQNTAPYQTVLENDLPYLPPFDKIFVHPRVVSVYRRILGEDFLYMHQNCIQDCSWTDWHSDTTSAEGKNEHEFHWSPTFRMVQSICYLESNEIGGFGLDVIPGSHMEDDAHAIRLTRAAGRSDQHIRVMSDYEIEQRMWRIPTRPGDIVIFNLRLYHRASPQLEPTGHQRKLGVFGIMGANNKATFEWHSWLKKYNENEDFLRSDVPKAYIDMVHSVGADIFRS